RLHTPPTRRSSDPKLPEQLAIEPPLTPFAPEYPQQPYGKHGGNDIDADGFGLQRPDRAKCQQRSGDPYQQGQRKQAKKTPQAAAEQKTEQTAHGRAPSCTALFVPSATGDTSSVISTLRFLARLAGLSLGASGLASPRPSARTRSGRVRRS